VLQNAFLQLFGQQSDGFRFGHGLLEKHAGGGAVIEREHDDN
jgi:hypothetical protein